MYLLSRNVQNQCRIFSCKIGIKQVSYTEIEFCYKKTVNKYINDVPTSQNFSYNCLIKLNYLYTIDARPIVMSDDINFCLRNETSFGLAFRIRVYKKKYKAMILHVSA